MIKVSNRESGVEVLCALDRRKIGEKGEQKISRIAKACLAASFAVAFFTMGGTMLSKMKCSSLNFGCITGAFGALGLFAGGALSATAAALEFTSYVRELNSDQAIDKRKFSRIA